MDEEKRLRINHLLHGGGTILYSLLTFVVAAFFLYVQTSPTEDVSRDVLIGGIIIFVMMTLLGAFGFGRSWRAPPIVVGGVAALPSVLFVSGSPPVFPLGIALISFVPYYIARRWFGRMPKGNPI